MTIVLNGSSGISAPGTETFGDGTALGGATNPIVSMAKGANNYVQGYIVNNTDGVNASADLVAYPSNGTDSSGWVDMGITGPTFSQAAFSVTGPNEAYLFGSAPSGAGKTGNLVIATDSTGTANAIQFYTGGFNQAKSAARMVIDGSGNVGIGTSSPANKLHVKSSGGIIRMETTAARGGGSNYLQFTDPTGDKGYVGYISGATDDFSIYSALAGNMQFFTGATERMRIDSSGNLLVGTTSTVDSGKVVSTTSGGNPFVAWNTATSGNNGFIAFGTEGTFAERGYIYYNRAAGLTQLSATSDYRAKTIIGNTQNALDKVLAIRVVDAKLQWAEGEAYPMFIAHQLQEIAPWAVSGEKDAVDDQGKPNYQVVAHESLVATLTAAIKEQQTIIQQLQADVAALKGNA